MAKDKNNKCESKVEKAKNIVAEKIALEQYNADSNVEGDVYNKGEGDDGSFEDLKDDEKRELVVPALAKNVMARMKYSIEHRFGLENKFDIDRYPMEDIEKFIEFYFLKVLDEETGLIRENEKASGDRPNRKIAEYVKKPSIQFGYERYFDYIIENRNRILKLEKPEMTFKQIKDEGATLLGFWYDNIRKLGKESYDGYVMWKKELEFVHTYIQDMYYEKFQPYYLKGESIDVYECYLFGIVMFECMLVCIDQVFESRKSYEWYIRDIEKQLDLAYEETKQHILDGTCDTIIEYRNYDIFSDYAMSYYLEIAKDENKIMSAVLYTLYCKTEQDNRRTYFEITRDKVGTDKQQEEYYIRRALFKDFGKNYDLHKIKNYKKNAGALCKALNESMYSDLTIDNGIGFVAFVEEIYNYDKEIEIDIDGKKLKYNMVNLAHRMIAGEFDKYNNRNAEVFMLNEKIKRGIDCRIRGQKYYRDKNTIYRKLYDIERNIWEEMQLSKKGFMYIPVFWYEFIEDLYEKVV